METIEESIKLSFWQRYKKVFWWSLIGLAVLTAALVVYILFFRSVEQTPTYQGDVKVELKAPEESASGSEAAYEIMVKNLSNSRLLSLNLEIFYPRGFTFIDSTPDLPPEDLRRFAFADLSPGEEDKLVIVGRLEGSVQEIKTMSLKLHYIPENFRSAFVAEASASTMILAPDLALKVFAPPRLVSGQTITYEFKITNFSSRSFSDLLLKVSYPEKFAPSSDGTSPPGRTTGEGAEWMINNLAVGETKNIIAIGRISAVPGTESFAQAELFLKDSDGDLVSAGRSYAFTEVGSSPLLLAHRLLGEPTGFVAGKVLKYEVTYQNNGEVVLNNLAISVVFENPAVFDLSKLSAPTGQLKGGTALFWVPPPVPTLLNLNPGAGGKFEFSVPVASDLEAKLQKNPVARTRVEFFSKELKDPIVGNVLEYKIQTQVHVMAQALIIGGQNPPAAGAETVYRVDLEVTNSVNDLRDAELQAVIPGIESVFVHESLSPQEEQANVEFTPVAGILRWRLGKVFALAGAFHEPRRLSFELKVTPQAGGFSSGVLLLRDIEVRGVDDFTNFEIVSNKIDSLTR